jgi:amidohydrolase
VQQIIGQHVFPDMETGHVGFRKGMYMASTDELYVTIKGKGGHAALPASYINPIMIAAAVLPALQEAFEKARPANGHGVLAFGKITGEGATNVIPAEVKLEGTLRTLDESFRVKMHTLIMEETQKVARAHGGDAEVEVRKGYPVLYNNEALTGNCEIAAKDFLDTEHVHELDLRMTAEDFAYYSQVVPACFYRLGTGNKAKGITSSVHTPTFDVDEEALKTGMGLMAYLAIHA